MLTDAQWTKFEAAIAAVGIRGARPRKDERRTIEAIIWRLDNGAKWRSIPVEFGDWHHAYLRFRRWAVRGVWDKISLTCRRRKHTLAFACIDGTITRAHQKAAGARPSKRRGCRLQFIRSPTSQPEALGRSRGGSAPRSWASATLLVGSWIFCWSPGRRTSLRRR